MEVVESFPCRLLLLAKDRPEMDFSERRTVAFDASSAVGKLKALSGPEIEHARCTGELCPWLFQLVCDMGRVWNTIQHISKLAPSMSCMLLSAHMMTKKLIALPPTRAAKSEFLRLQRLCAARKIDGCNLHECASAGMRPCKVSTIDANPTCQSHALG